MTTTTTTTTDNQPNAETIARQYNISQPAKEITFGIEIECELPDGTRAPNGAIVQDNMVGYHRTGDFDSRSFPGWSATRDGSIYARTGYYAVEFVSPVLMGESGWQAVRDFFGWLKMVGAKVNRSCGQHVHIGVVSGSGSENGDDQANWIANLMGLTSQYEDALYAMTGQPARREGSWARSIKTRSHKRSADAIKMAKKNQKNQVASAGWSTDGYRNGLRPHERYHLLNLTNVFSKRTVEFRWGNGTVELAKAQMHIGVALGLAEIARSNRNTKFTVNQTPVKTENKTYSESIVGKLMSRLCWYASKSQTKGFFGTIEEMDKARSEAMRLAKKYGQRLAGIIS